MIELTTEYWNTLASQLIVIGTLLGGFSFSSLFIITGIKSEPKLKSKLFKALTLASVGFIVSIFAMTNIIMRTTDGFPFEVTNKSLALPRILGMVSFLAGLVSILYAIAISGRIKDYNSKRFSFIVGVVGLVLIILLLS